MRSVSLVAWIAVALATVGSALAAEEYILNPEDVISISVWNRPDLSRTGAIRGGGEITFPPLGDVRAAGVSAASLGRTIEEQLTEILRTPTQVTVEVVAYNSRRVTVSGAVTSPGRFSFETIPSIVDVLGAAGGLGAGADLSRVQVFRREGERQSAQTVDLTSALQSGDFSALPALAPGDVVYVPTVAGPGGTESPNSVYISGDVARPGAYGIGSGLDLLKVVSLAGGTLPTADLGGVQIVGKDAAGKSFVVLVDLQRYLDRGDANFVVQPGDAVRVPSRTHAKLGMGWVAAREALGLSRDVLNLFLIKDVLRNNK
jgi:polysaccharide biosynthesis/export protein